MLYSIGEIALVVIGILIALQINNLNEYRKDRKVEMEVLYDIKKSLNSDLNKIILPNLDRMDKSVIELTAIIDLIDQDYRFKIQYFSLLSI